MTGWPRQDLGMCWRGLRPVFWRWEWSRERAAPAAVLLHGKAGDLLAKESGRAALLAGELPDQIGRVLKRMEKGRRKR